MTELLPSWKPGSARDAIVDFVQATVAAGVPVPERVSVFDNDGTLWCEKPMPIQLDFILRRLEQMAELDPNLRTRQPWRAAFEHDYGWLSAVLAQHYAGNDTDVSTLAAGVLAAFADITVEDFETQSNTFLRGTTHPTLGRGYLSCTYGPMIELIRYLEVNGFSNYIASGGGRDFMRPISDDLFGIPRERVIGSSAALAFTPSEGGGSVTRQGAADYLDDGPEKPVHIWTRTGRRPIMAAGNSNGDIEMLDFAQHVSKPFLRLLLVHDDPEREFHYTGGAERALARARNQDWTVVSMRDDWSRVF